MSRTRLVQLVLATTAVGILIAASFQMTQRRRWYDSLDRQLRTIADFDSSRPVAWEQATWNDAVTTVQQVWKETTHSPSRCQLTLAEMHELEKELSDVRDFARKFPSPDGVSRIYQILKRLPLQQDLVAESHSAYIQTAREQSTLGALQANEESSSDLSGTARSGTGTPDGVGAAELRQELQRFRHSGTWHYSARSDGFPAGKWQPAMANKPPLVFSADGTCQIGTTRNSDGSWNLASGRYAIDSQDLVVAVTRQAGVRATYFYRIESGRLIGSFGPTPRVTWNRDDRD